jgi:hypothetical protein
MLIAAAVAAAGCGGGGGSSPGVAAVPVTAATATSQATAVAASPTPPSSPGPSSASTQATYTSANPTITLPTVGMVASQITLPAGLVPDGTQLLITVSSGASTATSISHGSSVRRAVAIANSAWIATVTSPTTVSFDPSQITLTLAVGSNVPSNGTVTFYGSDGSNLTLLGTEGVDPASAGGVLLFDGTSPCDGFENFTEDNAPNTGTTGSVTASYNITQAQESGRVRVAQSTANCIFSVAPSAPALASGDLYVSDPGASAVFLFASGANGNAQPYTPLTAAPLIATDFAGELVTNAHLGTVEKAEIRPYGSTSAIDYITGLKLGTDPNGVAADPIGAHIALFGDDMSATTVCKDPASQTALSNCPPAVQIFDRAQAGLAAPAVAMDISMNRWFEGLWLDQNDDAFVSGTVVTGSSLQAGAAEFVPNFGVNGGIAGAFAVFPGGSSVQIATDAAGNVYVATPSTGVLVFAPGTTVAEATLPSSVLPNPTGPEGVAVDAQGNVYVSSPQVLGSNGSTVVTPAAILVFPPFANWSGASTLPLRTISGASTGLVSPGRLAVVNTSPSSPPSSSIVLNPATVSFTAAGQAQSVGVSESGYSGTFAESDTCSGMATIASASGGFAVTAAAAGTCYATISDTSGNTTKLGVTVTTTGFTISSHSRT